MSRLLRSAAIATVAIVAFSACGSGGKSTGAIARRDRPADTAPAQVKSPDVTTSPGPIRAACELVSRDEVASTVGNAVTVGSGQGSNCSWGTTVDGGTSATVTAVKPGQAKAVDACNGLRLGQPAEARHESVAGVGSSAVWVFQPLTTLSQGSLVACWSDSAVLVLLTGERDPGALRATAIALAQKVHSRS